MKLCSESVFRSSSIFDNVIVDSTWRLIVKDRVRFLMRLSWMRSLDQHFGGLSMYIMQVFEWKFK